MNARIRFRLAQVIVLSVGLAACGAHPRRDLDPSPTARAEAAAIADAAAPRSHVKVTDSSYVRATPVEYVTPAGGNVTFAASGLPLREALREVAGPAGYSVAFEAVVDPGRPVTVDLRAMEAESAIRELSLAAGYVAVVSKRTRSVIVADRATVTYRIPPHLIQNLMTQYSVGNSAAAGIGGSAGGSSGATGMPGAPGFAASASGAAGTPAAINASFSVSSRQDNDLESFRRFIGGIAGGDTSVQVMPESGLVAVRARGAELRRVTGFFDGYIRDAGAQVELLVSIVEVTLTNEFQFGIDWSRVVGLKGLLGSGGQATVQLANSGAVPTPALTTTVTSLSSSAIIKALEHYTRVRLISQPRLFALNHSPAIIHDGTQIPYLPSVSTTVTGTAGTTTNSGSVSFALDGVSLAFKPNILDGRRVEISVVPILSSVSEFKTFNLGNGAQLTAPRQPVTQSHMQVIVESGKTVIVGGAKSVNDTSDASGLPGTRDIPFLGKLMNGWNDNRTRKELVLLLHGTIIPAPTYDFVASESL
jgi:MSHA biogenesis protein MshL